LQGGDRELHDQLVDQRPHDVLNEEVVDVPALQVDVKAQRQRARDQHFVFVQLGHRNVQGLAGDGFAAVKGDAFDGARALHRPQGLCRERGAQSVW